MSERLTPRELKILGYVADGLTNKEIGAVLYGSEATIKVHLAHISDKLNPDQPTNRALLVAIGFRKGLLK